LTFKTTEPTQQESDKPLIKLATQGQMHITCQWFLRDKSTKNLQKSVFIAPQQGARHWSGAGPMARPPPPKGRQHPSSSCEPYLQDRTPVAVRRSTSQTRQPNNFSGTIRPLSTLKPGVL